MVQLPRRWVLTKWPVGYCTSWSLYELQELRAVLVSRDTSKIRFAQVPELHSEAAYPFVAALAPSVAKLSLHQCITQLQTSRLVELLLHYHKHTLVVRLRDHVKARRVNERVVAVFFVLERRGPIANIGLLTHIGDWPRSTTQSHHSHCRNRTDCSGCGVRSTVTLAVVMATSRHSFFFPLPLSAAPLP